MMRLGHLFVTLCVALVVLVSGATILDGFRSADADIGAPGVYANRGRIAQNLPLGVDIRVCSVNVPITTGIAVADMNKSLKDSGLVDDEVFTLVAGTCHQSTPALTDRVDSVTILFRNWYDPCNSEDDLESGVVAAGCVGFPEENLGATLPTFIGQIEAHLSFYFFNDRYAPRDESDIDDDRDLDMAYVIAHELAHVIGLDDEYYWEGTACFKSRRTMDVESLMQCPPDDDAEQPFLTQHDLDHLKRLYRPAYVTTTGGPKMVKHVGGDRIEFNLRAIPVKVDTGIELRRQETTGWTRVLKRWEPHEKNLHIVLVGQPAGELTYGIFRRTEVLKTEQAFLLDETVPGGGSQTRTSRPGGQRIGFLQELPSVTRKIDQRLSGFEYRPG